VTPTNSNDAVLTSEVSWLVTASPVFTKKKNDTSVDSTRVHVEPSDDMKPATDPPEDAVLPLRTNFSHTGKLAVAPARKVVGAPVTADTHVHPVTRRPDLANGQMLANNQRPSAATIPPRPRGALWFGAERRWRGFSIEVDHPRGDGSALARILARCVRSFRYRDA
jgi:hypothetical protein